MAKIEVYYDYYEDRLTPQWMIVKFKRGELVWDKRIIYIPVQVPFKCKLQEDFIFTEMSFSITQVDLVMNDDKEGHFGISLESVKNRIGKMRIEGQFPYEKEEIESFILQVGDIEEILAMDRNELYTWR